MQILINPEIPPSTSEDKHYTTPDIQPLTLSTDAAEEVQPSTSAAADVQPTAAGTVVILDFGKTRLPKHTYTEFYNIFQVEQPSLEIDGAIDFEKSKKMDKFNFCNSFNSFYVISSVLLVQKGL